MYLAEFDDDGCVEKEKSIQCVVDDRTMDPVAWALVVHAHAFLS